MYLHWLGLLDDWISPYRFATNDLKTQCIHHNMFILSDQYVVKLGSMSSAFAINIPHHKPSTTPINSRHPILMAVSGATFDLAATIRRATIPLLYSFLSCTTAPYATVTASANECKLAEISSPKLGCRHHRTRAHCRDVCSWNHCLAFFACSSFIGSSQSTPVVHISWRMILGANNVWCQKT